MMMAERIQGLIHKLETEAGARWLNYLMLAMMVVALAVFYDTHCYHNFSSPEAMDVAQVARNLSEGKGFSSDFIRPLDVYLLQKNNEGMTASGTNAVDAAQLNGRHPDLANAPLYPLVLAGLWKINTPDWKIDLRKPFWADGRTFMRYKPEFFIAIFNQLLLLAAVWLTFLMAKTLFDAPAGWLAAILVLGSDQLWKFSVSGLPTLLLLVIFLGLVWCLTLFEAQGRTENPGSRRQVTLAVLIGLLAGLGMLTRYSFGWVMVPVMVFFALFGGPRRQWLVVISFLVFTATVSPWVARNFMVSDTPFGTASFAVVEGTGGFPGSRLMQSLTPDMTPATWPLIYFGKLQTNLRDLLQDDMLRLGGGWMGILFLAGLLLGLRNVVARRLRYFAMMCLAVFLVVTALGRTEMTTLAPGVNGENLLVLLTPLVVIFGVAFFLTLLNQMNVPSLQVRYAVVGLVALVACQQFILTLLPPKNSPSAYPPYYPPEIQKVSAWMQPDELIMSDIPWAVAWYGDRQCAWTTLNSKYEFFQLNDVKPVRGLYLTMNTLDAKLYSECVQSGADSWENFGLKTVVANQIPDRFPLKAAPSDLLSGLFLTDRVRWETQ